MCGPSDFSLKGRSFGDVLLTVGILNEFFRFVFLNRFSSEGGHISNEEMKYGVKDEDKKDK